MLIKFKWSWSAYAIHPTIDRNMTEQMTLLTITTYESDTTMSSRSYRTAKYLFDEMKLMQNIQKIDSHSPLKIHSK